MDSKTVAQLRKELKKHSGKRRNESSFGDPGGLPHPHIKFAGRLDAKIIITVWPPGPSAKEVYYDVVDYRDRSNVLMGPWIMPHFTPVGDLTFTRANGERISINGMPYRIIDKENPGGHLE
jgi:hypothetical protein